MKNKVSIIVFSLLFCTVYAQDRTTELPFYGYFLWYNGTIGEQPIKAKIAIVDGEYDIYYSYNHSKKGIHLNEPKIKETTITAEAIIAFDKYTDGFVTLQLEDLWKPTGQLITAKGDTLPISLNVALKELPSLINNTSLKNEFAPLALNTSIKADSISVYYAERAKADNKRVFEKQTYTAAYQDGYNQVTYVDINYDGYLDISIGNAIYLFNTQMQRFEVENSDGDMYPGIEYMGVYNLYEHTFVSSHFRTIMWYKSINGVIIPYEREYYREYNNEDDLVEVSENRIRYVDGIEKYSHLDLYLKENDSIRLASEIVVAVIGNAEIIEGATLILRHINEETYFYKYENGKWEITLN